MEARHGKITRFWEQQGQKHVNELSECETLVGGKKRKIPVPRWWGGKLLLLDKKMRSGISELAGQRQGYGSWKTASKVELGRKGRIPSGMIWKLLWGNLRMEVYHHLNINSGIRMKSREQKCICNKQAGFGTRQKTFNLRGIDPRSVITLAQLWNGWMKCSLRLSLLLLPTKSGIPYFHLKGCICLGVFDALTSPTAVIIVAESCDLKVSPQW